MEFRCWCEEDLAACKFPDVLPFSVQTRMELMQLVQGQIAYSLDLYRQLLSVKNGNMAVSPLSMSTALAIAAAGAKGETLSQLVSHLKFLDSQTMHQYFMYIRNSLLKDTIDEGGPALDFANCVLVDKNLPLQLSFQNLLKEYYGAESSAVDFQTQAEWARVQVNMWVSQKTRGKINDLLAPGSVRGDTKFLISNSLYFKGQWEKKFDSSRTRNEPFYLLDRRMVSKPMMTTNEKQFIKDCGTFKVLKLPYSGANGGDKAFSMYIILPNLVDGLLELEKHLDATATGWFMEHLPTLREAVPVRRFLLPRFSISCGFEATNVLTSLGLRLPFDPQRADFSGMLNELAGSFPPLCISVVVHKATVEVDEEGTVATAATAVVAAFGSAAVVVTQEFVADHPFLFLIREDNSGVILFMGRVVDPE